jgi:hypothetical protein
VRKSSQKLTAAKTNHHRSIRGGREKNLINSSFTLELHDAPFFVLSGILNFLKISLAPFPSAMWVECGGDPDKINLTVLSNCGLVDRGKVSDINFCDRAGNR